MNWSRFSSGAGVPDSVDCCGQMLDQVSDQIELKSSHSIESSQPSHTHVCECMSYLFVLCKNNKQHLIQLQLSMMVVMVGC